MFIGSQSIAMRFNSEMECPFWQAEGGNKAACLSPMDADEDVASTTTKQLDWSKGDVLADQPAGSAVSGSSVMQNNLFVNCNNSFDNLSFPFVLTQYNGYCNSQKSLGAADTHSITANTIPFVGPYIKGTAPATTQEAIPTGYDPTQYIPNFYLAANSWPIAAGSDLGAPYDIDMNGNSIGATLGAFAPSGAGAAPPAPPTTTPPTTTDPTPPTVNPTPTPAPTLPHRRFRHH
jgi:hypothetical protein